MFTRIITTTLLFSFICACPSLADEWKASSYRKHAQIQYEVAKNVLNNVDVSPSSPLVLDIGCGDGRATRELILPLLKAQKVVGIDPSKNMLALANLSYKNIPSLSFAEGGFQTLREQKSYDVVTSFFALHWVPQEEQALAVKNMANALKPGGILIAAHVIHSVNPTIRTAILKTVNTDKWRAIFPDYQSPIYEADPYELQKLLTDNNLRIRRFVAFDYTTTFKNAQEFYEWLNGWSPFKSALGDQHEDFWMDVIQEYRTQTHQENDASSIVFKDPFIEIIAQKF